MNKGQLIDRIAKDANITKTQAQKAIESFTSHTMSAVSSGDKVTLVGFGSWSPAKRAARTGRNPQTGEAIKIPARTVAKFKPGKDFSSKM
ncbi:MAG: HU family DNA-binding protein [Bacteroidetes bacterium]|nr:HU family DNA-binding protein [Bacteroidota bacterium]